MTGAYVQHVPGVDQDAAAYSKLMGASALAPWPFLVHRTHLPVLGVTAAMVSAATSGLPPLASVVHREGVVLRTHQEAGVKFIQGRRGTFLADEMRVGKSPQIMYSHDPEAGVLILIGPVAARIVWHEWAARRFGACATALYSKKGCPTCTRVGAVPRDVPAFTSVAGRTPDPAQLTPGGCNPRVIFMNFQIAYGWSELFGALPIGTLAIDECFPAGALIDGRRIEDVRVGALVSAFDEARGVFVQRKVLTVFRHRPQSMVRVHTASGSIVCTAGQPFLTPLGWTPACGLHNGGFVLQSLRALHETRLGSPSSLLYLWQNRRGVGRFVGGEGFSLGSEGESLLFGGTQAAVPVGASLATLDVAQPDAQGRNTREGESYASCDGVAPTRTRRQREAASCGATAVGLRFGVGNGGCDSDPRAESLVYLPHLLQGGHRGAVAEDCCRSRWEVSQHAGSASAGQKERGLSAWAWVDRVEVLQPTSDGTFGGVCPDGLVYNLEVEDQHTYCVSRAEGEPTFVVHNCHKGGLQSRRNQVVEAVRRFNTRAHRVIAATGTPLENQPDGLWPILDILAPGAWGGYWEYCRRHAAAAPGPFGWTTNGSSHMDELRSRLTEVMLRRTWAEIRPGLPPIERTIELVPLPEREVDRIEEHAAKLRYQTKAKNTLVGQLATLRRLYAETKIAAGVDWACETIASGYSCVLWTYHRDVSAKTVEALAEKGVRVHGPIHGGVDDKDREAILENAAADVQGPRVLVATMDSLGFAVNLSWASHAGFIELDWIPNTIAQAEMRSFDGTRSISVTLFVTDTDTDRRLADALLSKLATQHDLGLKAGAGDVADVLRASLGVEDAQTLDQLAEILMADAGLEV